MPHTHSFLLDDIDHPSFGTCRVCGEAYDSGRHEPVLSTSVGIDAGGWYLEVYSDDCGSLGWGEGARVGRWYGSREECLALDPSVVELHPVQA